MEVFNREYSDESMIDLPEDIGDYSEFKNMHLIPKDRYGFHSGTFKVVVTWQKDEEDE